MKNVFVYQIVDELSDGVIASFIGPNDRYAIRQFKNFLSDPKLANNIDPSDFVLVKSEPVDVFESYTDFADSSDISCVCCGDSINVHISSDLEEVKDEA